MTPLAEFLQTNEEKLREDEKQRAARRAEWVGAVDRLLRQIEEWVRDADPKNLLHVERTVQEHREAGLGYYQVPALLVRFGTTRVEITPWARNVAGRLEVDESGKEHRIEGAIHLAEGGEKYTIYRVILDGREDWRLAPPMSLKTAPLTRQGFEAALLRLIK